MLMHDMTYFAILWFYLMLTDRPQLEHTSFQANVFDTVFVMLPRLSTVLLLFSLYLVAQV